MRYFDYLSCEEKESIFYSVPQNFDRNSEKEMLSYALGATLYMPATKANIAENIINKKHEGAMSIVICLEDAIGDYDIKKAEEDVCSHLKKIYLGIKNGGIEYNELPLIFLRVRNIKQMIRMAQKIGEDLCILTGFVFPKFSINNGDEYFEALEKINRDLGEQLYAMPILETSDIIYKETRVESLKKIRNIVDQYNDLVLNVRVGATDFSSLFSIRRGYDMTIYDIAVIRDCIGDILNSFARAEKDYVLSAPVWEYFSGGDRVLKPQLRKSIFQEMYGLEGVEIRKELLNTYLDGLIREILLDKANGFIGKTIIHPTHIMPVQSLYVVSHEEYMDALSIINNNNGKIGVMKSRYENKMNEIKPHLNWARKVLKKSKIYGVYNERKNFISLLSKQSYI